VFATDYPAGDPQREPVARFRARHRALGKTGEDYPSRGNVGKLFKASVNRSACKVLLDLVHRRLTKSLSISGAQRPQHA